MRRTAIGNFPTGWSAPSVSLTDTFEGAHVYRSLADGQYYLIVEDLLDNRYYELWRSSSAGGPWTKISERWAWRGNLVYNAGQWTTSVSHGELIRAGVNQRLEINDINRVDFLIQGTTQLSCCPYQQIPWDLGVIRNYTSGPTPTPTPGGAIRRLQSFNYNTRYIRHQGFRARIDANVSPFEDSQFRVVSGLATSSAIGTTRSGLIPMMGRQVFEPPQPGIDEPVWRTAAGLPTSPTTSRVSICVTPAS
jgi:hypothetical protein